MQTELPMSLPILRRRQSARNSLRTRAAMIIGITTIILPLVLSVFLSIALNTDPGSLRGLTLILALLAVALTSGAVALIVMERLILSRIESLSHQVDAIGTSSDPTWRVSLGGNDELCHLANAINDMLTSLERARQEQRQEVERSRLYEENLRARREFISTVSHELRTPLTPISGFVDMILLGVAGPINEDQRAFLQTIKANTNRMTDLVNDLLEVGRLEAGKIVLNREPVDLRSVIQETVDLLRSDLEARRHQLVLDIDPHLPTISADARRIGQSLANLLSNAIKYTHPEGKIWVRANLRNDGFVAIQIEDNGIGMSEEQQKHLFTPFYRADSPLRDEVGGTGLGLSIARSFVELHGGEIRVHSVPGFGTCFTLSLPAQQGHIPHDERAVGV